MRQSMTVFMAPYISDSTDLMKRTSSRGVPDGHAMVRQCVSLRPLKTRFLSLPRQPTVTSHAKAVAHKADIERRVNFIVVELRLEK